MLTGGPGVMADPKLNGGALLVEGGRAWEVEQGIDRTQPQWMGERLSADFLKGQELLGSGDSWTKGNY